MYTKVNFNFLLLNLLKLIFSDLIEVTFSDKILFLFDNNKFDFSAPFQIVISIVFLWLILGPSVLAGLLTMVLLIPVNVGIASMSKKFQIKQMKEKDKRVKMMSEILQGIKVIV